MPHKKESALGYPRDIWRLPGHFGGRVLMKASPEACHSKLLHM